MIAQEKKDLKEVIKRDFTIDYKELLLEDEILEKIINEAKNIEKVPCLYLYMKDKPEKPELSEDGTMVNEKEIKQIEIDFSTKWEKNKVPKKYFFYNWKQTEIVCSFEKAMRGMRLYKDNGVKEEEVTVHLSLLPQILVKRICEQAEYNITATKAANLIMGIKNKVSEENEEKLCSLLDTYMIKKGGAQQSEPFPEVLKTPKAQKIFNAAIKAGYMEEATDRVGYKRKEIMTKALLAYFGMKLNKYLDIKAGIYTKDGKDEPKISWKYIEIAFNEKDLKGAKNGWHYCFPEGYEKIDSFFEPFNEVI